MKNLFIKVLLFGLVIFVLDKAFLYFRYTAPSRIYDQRLERVLEGEIDQDIIIIGSSRGVEGINPWILEDSLNMTAFNLSYGGSKIEWQTFIVQALLEKARPKVIVKIVDEPREWMADSMRSYRYDLLYPLVGYKRVLDTLIAHGERSPILSRLFVTHQLSKSAYDIRSKPSVPDTVARYGSQTKAGRIREEDKELFKYNEPYFRTIESPDKRHYFEIFRKVVQDKGTLLLYVMPPNYHRRDFRFVDRVREVIGDSSRVFVPDIDSPAFDRDSMMLDPIHLNRQGAEWFTRSLVPFIRQNLARRQSS